jgi:c(7)-type cytochrome triheme protein
MKQHVGAICTIGAILISGTSLAVGPGKSLDYDNSMGTVIFNGTSHKEAGLSCDDCHNPGLFPVMKKGAAKMSMQEMNSGKYCGTCHDGKRAFLIKGSCNQCHSVAGA